MFNRWYSAPLSNGLPLGASTPSSLKPPAPRPSPSRSARTVRRCCGASSRRARARAASHSGHGSRKARCRPSTRGDAIPHAVVAPPPSVPTDRPGLDRGRRGCRPSDGVPRTGRRHLRFQRDATDLRPATPPADPARPPRLTATAIPGDDLYRRPRRQPCRDRARLAVRQQIDHAPPLQVADQRPVAMPLAPRTVVYAMIFGASCGAAARRRTVRRSVSLLTGSNSRRAIRCPGRPPSARPRCCTSPSSRSVRRAKAPCNRRLKPFREDPTGAVPLRAPEAPHLDADHDVTPMRRQVGQLPPVPTANHSRYHAAGGTGRAITARTGENPDSTRSSSQPASPPTQAEQSPARNHPSPSPLPHQ